jgi:hypothetical protein
MALRSTRVSSTSPFTTNANGWLVGGSTSGQALYNSTVMTIDCDTVHFDPTSGFNTSTNLFTTSVAGFYYLHAQALFQSATVIHAGERIDISIYVDDTRIEMATLLLIMDDADEFSNFIHPQCNGVYYIDAGSTVSARILQSTGATQYLYTASTSPRWTCFGGCLLAT